MPFEKIILGSFNQSHRKFGESAGKQCACCSLYAVLFSTVKSPGFWNTDEVDFIVTEGDKLYKTLNKDTYLMVSDLPQTVLMLGNNINIDYLVNEFGFLNFGNIPDFSFGRNTTVTGDGVLFFIKGLCLAMVFKKNSIFLFDSHSRNNMGKPSPDGFSMLIRFKNKRDLQQYIVSTYISENDYNIQYELQYIKIVTEVEGIDFSIENNKAARTWSNKKARKRKATTENKEKTRQRMTTAINKVKCRERKSAAKKQKLNSKNFYCVSSFQNKILEGPYFICVVCNRTLYKKTVKLFKESNYNMSQQDVFTDIKSFNSLQYICITCDKHLKKSNIPPQAVWNKLDIVDIPIEIDILNRLEKVLISKRILFKKIVVMPKGQQWKIKGAICNVPIQVEATTNCLPQGMDSNGLLFVKLKKKLEFQGHVLFESVRPERVRDALNILKETNPFYSDILIRLDNITPELLSLSDTDAIIDKNEFSITVDVDEENLEDENPLSANCANSDEMCTIPNFHNPDEEVLDIAPGENKQPQAFFTDIFCEELAFPYLFPSGKFGYKVARPVHLTPTKYFNQRLLNYSQRFSSNADYIFFAHYVVQQANLYNQINIATKKVTGSLTAGQLQTNFQDTVRSFICEDQGYLFMNSIKGTPAYWKHFLYDVLAMVKQLGLPTFFLTLSCADLKWEELVLIIAKLNNITLNTDDLDYFKRCNILNQNPVLTARHFQYRVELFFKEILLHKNSPVGQVENHAIKVEFQFRGSPHIHAFLWVSDPPTLSSENVDKYAKFVDATIRADLPDKEKEPKLYELVSQYQIHTHSKSCRKYKNVPCRFNYGRFFTDRTIIAKPLPENMSDFEKSNVLEHRNKILKKVKAYIDDNLFPHNLDVNDVSRSIPEILQDLEITEADYYQALSTSPNQDFEIHYYRPPNSCFVNNYFTDGLLAWTANLDLQPVFNYYKAVSYMCSYFSKTENESSLAMKKAAEESENLNLKEKMRKIALVFLSHRQCSVQEAIYQIMPELWLRRCLPGVVFANTNLPDRRYRICKPEAELAELPPDSTDVFKRNSLDRYMDRPNSNFKGGKYSVIDNLCYAEFLSCYELDTSKKVVENDCQPEVLQDDCDETHQLLLLLPKSVPLMSSKDKLKRRNKKRIVRYHTPNPINKPEAYAHHMMMLFLPFRKESELSSEARQSYVEKLNDSVVIEIVNENKVKFEPWGDMVDQVLMNADFNPRTDCFAQQENDNVEEEFVDSNDYEGESADPRNSEQRTASGGISVVNLMSDDKINDHIQSLNQRQRCVFEILNRWSRVYVKNLSAELTIYNPPLYLFITGGAGTGKSHLIKTITAAVSKTLAYGNACIEKPNVLLLAPTGVAAVNINGTTIHSALGISIESRGMTLQKLSDKRRCKLREQLSDVKLIIIDEVSMVSNKLLLYIHQRLIEIFGCVSDFSKPFAGLTLMLVGDLYQLPPVSQKPIYSDFSNELYNIYPLWRNFQICELTEVMRQKGDTVLIDLLNNVRIGNLSLEDENILRSRFVTDDMDKYPRNALHIFAENEPAKTHNLRMLNTLNTSLFTVNSIDQVPKEVPPHVYNKILNLNQMRTGGLAHHLTVKIGARVMLTSNIDIADMLINGQIGTVVHVIVENSIINVIYVSFDNHKAGLLAKHSDCLAQQFNAIPIKRVTTEIKTNDKKFSSPVVKRTQFPLMLSWACTVHKVQGLSLNEVVISFDLLRQRSFNSGQMYVALSRVTSLDGLFLLGKFNPKAISVDKRVEKEYQYLRENQSISFDTNLLCETEHNKVWSLVVCNVRSLRKHVKDLEANKMFLSNDIILCTETQLVNENISELRISEFNLTCNNDAQHKFSGLAFYLKHDIDLIEHFTLDGFSVIELARTDSIPINLKILLLYRKKSSPIPDFLETLRYLTTSMNIDIVAGDFNLKPSAMLQETLDNYKQLVLEPTHLGGSILDHVYIKKCLFVHFTVVVNVKSLFFTDHEAVLVSLYRKSG